MSRGHWETYRLVLRGNRSRHALSVASCPFADWKGVSGYESKDDRGGPSGRSYSTGKCAVHAMHRDRNM